MLPCEAGNDENSSSDMAIGTLELLPMSSMLVATNTAMMTTLSSDMDRNFGVAAYVLKVVLQPHVHLGFALALAVADLIMFCSHTLSLCL